MHVYVNIMDRASAFYSNPSSMSGHPLYSRAKNQVGGKITTLGQAIGASSLGSLGALGYAIDSYKKRRKEKIDLMRKQIKKHGWAVPKNWEKRIRWYHI